MAQDIQTSSSGDTVAVTGHVAFGHYPTRPYSVLKLCRAEITSVSHLYTTPVNSFKKITISVGCQPASKWADPPHVADDTSPNVNAEADLTFRLLMSTIVDVPHR
jgi:hypothetical protein